MIDDDCLLSTGRPALPTEFAGGLTHEETVEELRATCAQ